MGHAHASHMTQDVFVSRSQSNGRNRYENIRISTINPAGSSMRNQCNLSSHIQPSDLPFLPITTSATAKKLTPSVCLTKREWPWRCRVRLSSLTAYANFAIGRWAGSRNAFVRRTAPSGTVSFHSNRAMWPVPNVCIALALEPLSLFHSHIYL